MDEDKNKKPPPDPALTQTVRPKLLVDNRERIGGRPPLDHDARAKLCEELCTELEPLWRAKLVKMAKTHKPRQHEGVKLVNQLLKNRKQTLPVKVVERDIAAVVQRRLLQER
jgi:hypothetical protein